MSKGDRVGAPPGKRPPREPLALGTASQEGTVEQTTEPVDELIGQVERFYQSLTGQTAPPPRDAPYAPIPPEKDPERYLAEQVDNLLASLGQLSPGVALTAAWVPPLALWETPSETWVCLDVPGVTREAVKIRILGQGVLEISGERPIRRFDGDARRLHDESSRGPFRRLVPLPPRAVVDGIDARVRNGALEIRIPRTAPREPEVRTVAVS